MRISIARSLVVSGLAGLALLVGYSAAPLAQGQPAEPGAKFAPGHGGGFGQDSPKLARPLEAIYLTAPITAAAARTWIRLQEPISLNFAVDTPLNDAIKVIREATTGKNEKGISFYIDPVGLQEAEKTINSPVVLALDDVPVSTALTLMLKQLGLTFSVQKDGIVIITNESNEAAFSDPAAKVLEEVTALRLELQEMRRLLGLRRAQ